MHMLAYTKNERPRAGVKLPDFNLGRLILGYQQFIIYVIFSITCYDRLCLFGSLMTKFVFEVIDLIKFNFNWFKNNNN